MIEVKALSKSFPGRGGHRVDAVKQVSFFCESGQVLGLVGGNGAGKTTLLRMLSTAIKPTDGEASILGMDLIRDAQEIRRRLSLLSASSSLYGLLTVREYLTYFGKLYQIRRNVIKERISVLAEMLDYTDSLDRLCEHLSTGTKQKIVISRALIHEPTIILCDEPTSGLDVVAAHRVVSFVNRCKAEGRTVIYCTHNISEIDQLCDRVVLISNGSVAFSGTTENLKRSGQTTLEESILDVLTVGVSS